MAVKGREGKSLILTACGCGNLRVLAVTASLVPHTRTVFTGLTDRFLNFAIRQVQPFSSPRHFPGIPWRLLMGCAECSTDLNLPFEILITLLVTYPNRAPLAIPTCR
jgi:hypothetical protein